MCFKRKGWTTFLSHLHQPAITGQCFIPILILSQPREVPKFNSAVVEPWCKRNFVHFTSILVKLGPSRSLILHYVCLSRVMKRFDSRKVTKGKKKTCLKSVKVTNFYKKLLVYGRYNLGQGQQMLLRSGIVDTDRKPP